MNFCILVLADGTETIISHEDAACIPELLLRKWRAHEVVNQRGVSKKYVSLNVRLGHRFKRLYLHRLVCERNEAKELTGLVVDHFDSDTFNNTRENLNSMLQKDNVKAWQRKKFSPVS